MLVGKADDGLFQEAKTIEGRKIVSIPKELKNRSRGIISYFTPALWTHRI